MMVEGIGRPWRLLLLFVLCFCSVTRCLILDNAVERDGGIEVPLLDSEETVTGNVGFLNPSEERSFDLLDRHLTQMLLQTWPQGNSPLLYIEDTAQPFNFNGDSNQEVLISPMKRSRYHRKHPWRRVYKTKDTMDRFICSPSKEDIFRLLVALHEIRNSKGEGIVNICDKRRPVHLVFSNIRFLASRK